MPPPSNRISAANRRAVVSIRTSRAKARAALSSAPVLRLVEPSAPVTSSLAHAALDTMSCGVILITATAYIVFANRRAREMMARADALVTTDCCLRFLQAPLQEKFFAYLAARPIDANSHETDCFAVGLPRKNAEPSYAMTIKPLSADRGSYGVYLYDFDREHVVNAVLCRVYGLTASETHVALLLYRGLNVEQAARTLAIRESTVRTHLTKILAKCEVRSTAELLQHLALGPREE